MRNIFRYLLILIVSYTHSRAMEEIHASTITSWKPVFDYLERLPEKDRKKVLVATDLDNTLFGSTNISSPTLFPGDFDWLKNQTLGIIGLTSRTLDKDLLPSRQQLVNFGINFSHWDNILFSGYDNGCIYHDPQAKLTKGQSLQKFLESLNNSQTNVNEVIFVDDEIENLYDVKNTLSQVKLKLFQAKFINITPPVHEGMNDPEIAANRSGISMSEFYGRVEELNKQWNLSYTKNFEDDVYPSPPYEFGDGKDLSQPDTYKKILAFYQVYHSKPYILAAHAFNPTSIKRVLGGYFDLIDSSPTGHVTGASMTNKHALLLAPFSLTVRALISSSLIDLNQPNTLKTTSPYGVLFHVPWETIYAAGDKDMAVPMEHQGGVSSQRSFINSLYKKSEKPNLRVVSVDGEDLEDSEQLDLINDAIVQFAKNQGVAFRYPNAGLILDRLSLDQLNLLANELNNDPTLSFARFNIEGVAPRLIRNIKNTADEILNSESAWNEVAFYPRVTNPQRESRIVAFFIDSRETRAAHSINPNNEEIKDEELKSYFKLIKDLAAQLNLPIIDFADYVEKSDALS